MTFTNSKRPVNIFQSMDLGFKRTNLVKSFESYKTLTPFHYLDTHERNHLDVYVSFHPVNCNKLAERVRSESGRDGITEVKQGTRRQNNRNTSTGLPTKRQCQGKTDGTPVPEYAYRIFSDVYDIITARKRSLGQGNIFTPVCHSVHRGRGVCLSVKY